MTSSCRQPALNASRTGSERCVPASKPAALGLKWTPTTSRLVCEAAGAFGRGDTVVHLNAFDGTNLIHIEPHRSGLGIAIERDADLSSAAALLACREIADRDPFEPRSKNCEPLPSPWHVRCEDTTATSLTDHSAAVVILSVLGSGSGNLDALVREVRRIAERRARIVVLSCGVARVQDWSVDDHVAPYLSALRAFYKPNWNALETLGLQRVASETRLFEQRSLTRDQFARLLLQTPELHEQVENQPIIGTTQISYILRKFWKRRASFMIRRELRVFAGRLP